MPTLYPLYISSIFFSFFFKSFISNWLLSCVEIFCILYLNKHGSSRNIYYHKHRYYLLANLMLDILCFRTSVVCYFDIKY